MNQHLREMSNMTKELNNVDQIISNEQYGRVVIRSLLHNWECTMNNMTHNESIKTFDDI